MDDVAPLTLDEKTGAPPKSRIPTAEAARELFEKAWAADKLSAENRTSVQKMIDGHPPFNAAEQRKIGLAGASNLNFGEAQADMDRAIAAFNDMMMSQERMAFVKLRPVYATATRRGDLQDKIAIAFHKANVGWEEYFFEQQMISWYFNKDGVAVYLYPDDRDPRWRSESLDGFKIPRGTKASEDKVEYAFARHDFQVHELWDKIKDRETAEALGWNYDACKQAIIDCHDSDEDKGMDWAAIETRLKNNDYYAASAKASKIRAWDCFGKEFDGSYSHHIFKEKGDGQFLASNLSQYKKATEAFIISTYGIGTNGCYHGIRGLGFRIFPFCDHSNRLRNKTLDSAMVSSTLMFETSDAAEAQRAGIAYIGPYGLLPTGMKPVPITFPNVGQNSLPVIADLAKTRLANTGGFMTAGGGNVERKELEIQQEMAQQAVLPSSAINLFMIGRGKMMTEQLRRMSLTDWVEGEPGYEMAMAFQNYLKEMDVPMEALKYVESIVPARALGAGSPAARQLALNKMMQFKGDFDEIGQNNVLRDMVGSEVGFDQVDRYVPQLENHERPVIDEKIAELENIGLKDGTVISILDGEDDAIHLKVHVAELVIAAHAMQQGGDLIATLKFFSAGIPHSEQHMSRLAKDVSRMPLIKGMQPVLAGLNTMATTLAQVVQQHSQAQASAPATGGAQPPGAAPSASGSPQLSPEQQAKIQAAQIQIQIAVQSAQSKMAIKAQESQQRMALRDAREAQSLQLSQQRQQAAQETAQ